MGLKGWFNYFKGWFEPVHRCRGCGAIYEKLPADGEYLHCPNYQLKKSNEERVCYWGILNNGHQQFDYTAFYREDLNGTKWQD